MTRMLLAAQWILCLTLTAGLAGAESWSSFRGPGARGVADGEDLPIEWDVASGKNVRFKTATPTPSSRLSTRLRVGSCGRSLATSARDGRRRSFTVRGRGFLYAIARVPAPETAGGTSESE